MQSRTGACRRRCAIFALGDRALSRSFEHWVEECATLTKPAKIVWCDGSLQEYETLVKGMLAGPWHLHLSLNEETFSPLVPAPQRSQRCGPHGKPDLHLHP